MLVGSHLHHNPSGARVLHNRSDISVGVDARVVEGADRGEVRVRQRLEGE